jgi:hypothetical protein
MPVEVRDLAREIYRLAKLRRLAPPGATRLVKLIYLADVEWRRCHQGEPLTNASWRFLHFGPYAKEFAPLLGGDDVEVQEQSGRLFKRLQFSDEDLDEQSVPNDVSRLLDNFIKQWGDADLNLLLDYVYFETEPMENATRGRDLDFSGIAPAPTKIRAKIDTAKLALFREKLRIRARALSLSREPLKLSIAKDGEEAWGEDFPQQLLPPGIRFKISD